MIATMAVQHPRRVPSQLHHCARDSNQAGAPLPLIPRRTTRSQSLPFSHYSAQRPFVSAPNHCWNQCAIDSDSSSSSGSEGSKSTAWNKRKRPRGIRPDASNTTTAASPTPSSQPPADSRGQTCQQATVIAAPRPLVYTPGMLRLSLETIRSHMLANPHPSASDSSVTSRNGSKSAPPHRNISEKRSPFMIRKKSGQPVKSSLKSSRCTQGDLSVITIGSSSKSEPPTPKVVHFDPQLEHVKLFLAEQKPLAVSRDGSPTEDTDGTDSDFPSFIYGDDDKSSRPRKKMEMRRLNIVNKIGTDASVLLEDFYLNFDGTNILGKIRVRNIAYAKTVAVRFTFDSWQTTSEVTARYTESINPQYDRFSFSVRLNDIWARIEGKTLMMAIRYNVAGQEFWDNNHGQDHIATFTKPGVAGKSKRSDDEDASDVENLRNRLQQVALYGRSKPSSNTAPSKSPVPQLKETDPPSLNSGVALSSRYDIATSLRNSNTWRRTDVPECVCAPNDNRSLSPSSRRSKLTTSPVPSNSIPWPEKNPPTSQSATLPASLPSLKGQSPPVSSRDLEEEHLSSPSPLHSASEQNESTNGASAPVSTRGRNHRRGYSVDADSIGINSSVRRTPPGTPTSQPSDIDMSFTSTSNCSSPSFPRYHSFPPLTTTDKLFSSSSDSTGFNFTGMARETHMPLSPPTASRDFHQVLCLPSMTESSGDSELSTPSLSTPTSSRSPTPSPTDTFRKPALPPLSEDGFCLGPRFHPIRPGSPGTRYRHFLDKFCFFTGSAPRGEEEPPSEKQIYTEESPQSRSDGHATENSMRTNQGSDDLVTISGDSGTATPTISQGKWGSRAATPVP